MPKIRVLIADDHALVREGISALLGFCNDIEVVGEASDGIEAIERTRAVKPDIVLMDIGMPRLGGLEATVELRKTEPDVKIIILTQYDDREYISRFLKAGVSGISTQKGGRQRACNSNTNSPQGRDLSVFIDCFRSSGRISRQAWRR